MLYYISCGTGNTLSIKRSLLDSDILAYQIDITSIRNILKTHQHLEDFPEPPSIVIADATEKKEAVEDICQSIKNKYPQSKCIAIMKKNEFPESRYRYFKNADFEIYYDISNDIGKDTQQYLKRLGYAPERKFNRLDMRGGRKTATLLNYPIELTPSEHRILLYLTLAGGVPVNESILLKSCFCESYRMLVENVRVHISNINKKAKFLGGRPLICRVKSENEYFLNPYM